MLFIVIMTTPLPGAPSTHDSSIECSAVALLLEPLLIVGSALFWMLVLPLAAIARLTVGAYDTAAAMVSRIRQLERLRTHKANPLVLRKGSTPATKPIGPARVARHSI